MLLALIVSACGNDDELPPNPSNTALCAAAAELSDCTAESCIPTFCNQYDLEETPDCSAEPVLASDEGVAAAFESICGSSDSNVADYDHVDVPDACGEPSRVLDCSVETFE